MNSKNERKVKYDECNCNCDTQPTPTVFILQPCIAGRRQLKRVPKLEILLWQ